MAKPELEFFDPEVSNLSWRPIADSPEGLFEKILSMDENTGDKTRLVKALPGARIDRILSHDYWEEVYFVDGAVVDLTLDKIFTKGMYCCRPPGMKHGPYEFPYGATLFEVHHHDRK